MKKSEALVVEKAARHQAAQQVREHEGGKVGRPEEGHQPRPGRHEEGADCKDGRKIEIRQKYGPMINHQLKKKATNVEEHTNFFVYYYISLALGGSHSALRYLIRPPAIHPT